MKLAFTLALVITAVASASLSNAQTLYAPGAAVGNSGNNNVGIGTAAPAAKLHVGGSNQEIRFDYNGTSSYYGSLRWSGLQLGNNGANRIVAGRSVVGALLDFYVNNTNDAADYNVTPNGVLAMRLAANGNVSIGTANSPYKLSVESGANSFAFRTHAAGDFVFTLAGDGQAGSNLDLFSIRNNNTGVVHVNTINGARMALGVSTGSTTGATVEGVTITALGNVGIGTINPTQRLSVNGTIRSKEVIVETTGWSDYVLAKDYTLQPLSSVEEQIERDGHLPGIPSAREVAENGISVGAMQAKLLAKIEELTLHQIAQEKRQTVQELKIVEQASRIEHLERENARFTR